VRFAVVAASGKQYDFHGGRASPMASTIKVMLLRDGRMRHFRYSSTWGLSRASAADGASLMSRFEDIVPRRHEGYAKHLLASIVSSQRWGVARARPRGWKLFFKGGWGVGTGEVNHQIGFLQRHDSRVALAIHTEFSRSHAYGKRRSRGSPRACCGGCAGADHEESRPRWRNPRLLGSRDLPLSPRHISRGSGDPPVWGELRVDARLALALSARARQLTP
jgi:hypothetical protein